MQTGSKNPYLPDDWRAHEKDGKTDFGAKQNLGKTDNFAYNNLGRTDKNYDLLGGIL